jgi:hypothetical protein
MKILMIKLIQRRSSKAERGKELRAPIEHPHRTGAQRELDKQDQKASKAKGVDEQVERDK